MYLQKVISQYYLFVWIPVTFHLNITRQEIYLILSKMNIFQMQSALKFIKLKFQLRLDCCMNVCKI